MLPLYSRVRLVTDRFENEGARTGMHGYVIEDYEDGNYEVEFSDPATGATLAQLVLREEDVVPDPENN
ncbi:MAG TPA: DUF4926 domain-containing protein [Polyangiaceae bacterium]|jgi:uncharacterized protein DUF4926|nr:DUF4926 domain-containing protein [Polyangiaceae bacterium]